MGAMDTLAILPMWLFTGFDLKALRAFRLFRLFRSTTRIAGRSGAVVKLGRAFAAAKDEAGVLLTGTGVLIVTAGLGMFHLEHDAQPAVFDSVLDGLWWADIDTESGIYWYHLVLRDVVVDFPPFDSRQVKF